VEESVELLFAENARSLYPVKLEVTTGAIVLRVTSDKLSWVERKWVDCETIESGNSSSGKEKYQFLGR
jgi:hypothetical protein